MLKEALKLFRINRKLFLRKGLIYIDSKLGFFSLILLPYIKNILNSMKNWRDALEFLYSNSFISELIRPMQVREEIEGLLGILERVRPRVVLEIGTARGGTLFLWTRVAAPDALIVSIDLPGGPFGGGYAWLRGLLYRRFAREGQRIVLLRRDSHEPATLREVKMVLGGHPVDFLFIDGDHSYEGVRRDFEMYSPLVRRGIIAFHDIVPHPPEMGCEVNKFWNEIRRNYRYLEIVKDWGQGWAGIGVLYV